MLTTLIFTLLVVKFSYSASLDEQEIFTRSNESRIVNGEILDIESVPYYVSVFKPPNFPHYCGGAIIHLKWILSAAHCYFSDNVASNYFVRSGTTRVTRGGKITNITKIFVHSSYNDETYDFDYALLQLKTALALNDRTQVIKLPDSTSYYMFEGSDVLVSGHGLTQNEQQSTEFLRGVVMKIESPVECATTWSGLYDGQYKITSNMICASTDDDRDSCKGDSGGPMERLSDGVLVGIVSFGNFPCANPDVPGVYSKVAAARDWIKTTAKV